MSSENIILDENLDGNEFSTDQVVLASATQRFVNNIVDSVVVWILIMVYIMGILEFLGMFDNPDPESLSEGPYISLAMWMYAIPPVYYISMEFFFGRTIGKYISGCRVADAYGNNPSFLNALLRTLIRVVPFEFVSAFSSSRRMWHDSWTNTFVIKTR